MMDFVNGMKKGLVKGAVDQAWKVVEGSITKTAMCMTALREIASGEYGDGTCGCARRAARAVREAEKAA